MKKQFSKVIAVVLAALMVMTIMPMTAFADPINLYCKLSDGEYQWLDNSNNVITNGYTTLQPETQTMMYNSCGSDVTISNSYDDISGVDVCYSDSQCMLTNYSSTTTYYLALSGTTATVYNSIPTYSVTILAGSNGTLSTESTVTTSKNYTNIESGTEITVDENTLDLGREETLTADPDSGYEFDSWSGVPDSGVITANTTITANFKEKAATKTEYNSDITVSWKDGYTPAAGDTVATLKENLVCSDTDNLTYEVGIYDSSNNQLSDTYTLTAGSTYYFVAFAKVKDNSTAKFSTDASGMYAYYTASATILGTTFAANTLQVGDDRGFCSFVTPHSNGVSANEYSDKVALYDLTSPMTFTVPAAKTEYNSDITVSWKDGYTPKAGDTVSTVTSNLVGSDTDNLDYEFIILDSSMKAITDTTTVLTAGSTYYLFAYVKVKDNTTTLFSNTKITDGDTTRAFYTSQISIIGTSLTANNCVVGDDGGEYSIWGTNCSIFDKIECMDSNNYVVPSFTVPAAKTEYNTAIMVSWKSGYTPTIGDTVATVKSNLVGTDTDNLTYEYMVCNSTYDELDDTDTLIAGETYYLFTYARLTDNTTTVFSYGQEDENTVVYYQSPVYVLGTPFDAGACAVGDHTEEYFIKTVNATVHDKVVLQTTTTTPSFTASEPLDKSALEAAVTKARSTLASETVRKQYTEDTVENLYNIANNTGWYALNHATTQAQIDTVTQAILDAIDALELQDYTVTAYKIVDDAEIQIASETLHYGDTFTTSVDLTTGESVYKWTSTVNDSTTKLPNDTSSATIVVNGDTTLTCYIKNAPGDVSTKALVKYVNRNERVVAVDYATIGSAYTPVDSNAPSLAFYDFAGWTTLQGDLSNVDANGIILKATYEATNYVSIIGIDGAIIQGTAAVDGKSIYSAAYDEKVELTGGTNYVFCDADGNEISGINDEYIYAPHKDTIYIKPVDSKSTDASTRVTGSFTENGYFTIDAQYYLPDGCTAVEAGVVVSKTNTDPWLGGSNCTTIVSSSQGTNHEYSISIACSSTGTLYTASYLIYKDASGTLHTTYSDANALSYGE